MGIYSSSMVSLFLFINILKQGNRAQIDRVLYKKNMQEIILNTPNLNVIAEPVDNLLLLNENEKQKAAGVLLGSILIIEFTWLTKYALIRLEKSVNRFLAYLDCKSEIN